MPTLPSQDPEGIMRMPTLPLDYWKVRSRQLWMDGFYGWICNAKLTNYITWAMPNEETIYSVALLPWCWCRIPSFGITSSETAPMIQPDPLMEIHSAQIQASHRRWKCKLVVKLFSFSWICLDIWIYCEKYQDCYVWVFLLKTFFIGVAGSRGIGWECWHGDLVVTNKGASHHVCVCIYFLFLVFPC